MRTCRAKQGAPGAPERVDRAEDGWAPISLQPLADWDSQRLAIPLGLAPRFLWRPLEPTPSTACRLLAMEELAEAFARERLWDLLQARSTGWVRAVRVAAPLLVDGSHDDDTQSDERAVAGSSRSYGRRRGVLRGYKTHGRDGYEHETGHRHVLRGYTGQSH